MSTKIQAENGLAAPPGSLLHAMLRVGNLTGSFALCIDALGMRELRREEYPDGRFTLVFVGYGDETSNMEIELTNNWDTASYEHGAGYEHYRDRGSRRMSGSGTSANLDTPFTR